MNDPKGLEELRTAVRNWTAEGERLVGMVSELLSKAEDRGIKIGIERERERVNRLLNPPSGRAESFAAEAPEPKARGGAAPGYGDISTQVREALADLGYSQTGHSPQDVLDHAKALFGKPLEIEQVRTVLKVMAKPPKREAQRVERGRYVSINAGKRPTREPDMSSLALIPLSENRH